MQQNINAPTVAYTELEMAACSMLNEHNASLFSDLPSSVQSELLALQEEVFAKHGVTREDFLDTDAPFIAVD